MQPRIAIIRAAIIGLFVSIAFGVFITRTEPSRAAKDDVLTAISGYKSWGRITKEPYTVNPFPGNANLKILQPGDTSTEGLQIDLRALG